MSTNLKQVSDVVIAPGINTMPQAPLVQMTQLKIDFKIDKVFEIS